MRTPTGITFRVRYAETDQMGVVYHANYFAWFEMGRVELLRDLGFSYKHMEQEDCSLPVVEATCRYRFPAHYDDVLTLETRVAVLRGSLIKFAYHLCLTGGELGPQLLAEAETTHLVVDRAMKKRRMPDKYATALQAAMLEQQPVVASASR